MCIRDRRTLFTVWIPLLIPRTELTSFFHNYAFFFPAYLLGMFYSMTVSYTHLPYLLHKKEQKGQIRTFTPGASMSSSVLLSPLTIRKTTLRNRIMLPSMVTHYCAVNGEVSERLIAYHAERAYGGVGLTPGQ